MRLKNLQLVDSHSTRPQRPLSSQTATTRYVAVHQAESILTTALLDNVTDSPSQPDRAKRAWFRETYPTLLTADGKRACYREAGCQTSSLGIDWHAVNEIASRHKQSIALLPSASPSLSALQPAATSPRTVTSVAPTFSTAGPSVTAMTQYSAKALAAKRIPSLSASTPTASHLKKKASFHPSSEREMRTPIANTIRMEHHTPKMMSHHFHSYSFSPTTSTREASTPDHVNTATRHLRESPLMKMSRTRTIKGSPSPTCSTFSEASSPPSKPAFLATKASPTRKISSLLSLKSMLSAAHTPASTAYFTPAPIPSIPENPAPPSSCNPQDLVKWEDLLLKFRECANYKDCTVPHSILVDLQEQLLDKVQELDLSPIFILQSTLQGQSPIPIETPGFLVSKEDVARLHRSIPKITDVLAETNISFFQRHQTQKLAQDSTQGPLHPHIDQFLDNVGVGKTGGRSSVGIGVRQEKDFPVCMFGVGPFDAKLNDNLNPCQSSGPMRWKTFCKCCSPLRVSVLLESRRRSTSSFPEDDQRYLKCLTSFLGQICSDWQSHRIRIYFEESKRFQRFLPIMQRISQKELLSNGWGSMKFDGSNLIHWKAVSGGVFLTYMAGYVDTAIPEALTLIWDGDSHKSWIPFLTETKREYCVNPWGFVLSYAVGLPWPLSKRGLHFFGMSTDALLVKPLHAVQVWGYSIPETVTTIFGVPSKLSREGQSVMEMELPAMSFSITPVGPRKVYLSVVAMLDVKINFIPTALQTSMAKIMGTKMFGNVQKLCKEFDKGPYKKVLQELKDEIAPLIENVKAAEVAAQKVRSAG